MKWFYSTNMCTELNKTQIQVSLSYSFQFGSVFQSQSVTLAVDKVMFSSRDREL